MTLLNHKAFSETGQKVVVDERKEVRVEAASGEEGGKEEEKIEEFFTGSWCVEAANDHLLPF